MGAIKRPQIGWQKLALHQYKETGLYGFLNSASVGESYMVSGCLEFTKAARAWKGENPSLHGDGLRVCVSNPQACGAGPTRRH